MSAERKKLGFEKFFSVYFSNIGKFTLLNLIFAVPLVVAFALCAFLCQLFPQATMFILPLVVALVFPFYSGVVVVCRNIYNDELIFGVFTEYLDAVKENFRAYLLHGVLAYFAFVGCYHGIVIYSYLAGQSWVFYLMLFASVIIALFFLFCFYAAPLMSASFDLDLKSVYKNSALMTFGELKANFLSTLCIVACLAIVSLPVMFFFYLTSVWGALVSTIVIYAYIALAMILVVPVISTCVLMDVLYPNMKRVVTGEARKSIEEARTEDESEKSSDPSVTAEDEELSQPDIEAIKKSDSEYVFYKGRMIKKSVMLQELEAEEE